MRPPARPRPSAEGRCAGRWSTTPTTSTRRSPTPTRATRSSRRRTTASWRSRTPADRPAPKIIPDLALAVPKPTDGGKTYTFRLRKGVKFGPPVSRTILASDVKASIQRLFRMNSPGISYYDGIVGAQAYQKHKASNIKGIVANDATGTVTFHLSAPDGTFLYYMALTFADVLPKQTPARDISTMSQWRVPTGPYQVSEYVPKDHITIVRNPGFHQWTKAVPDGYLDEIDLQIGVTSDQAVNEVANGSLDWYMQSVAPGRLTEVRARYPKQVHLFPKNNITYFSLNTRKAPLNDVRVRKAINYAVDRRALVKIFGGQGVPAENIVPPGLGASFDAHHFYPYNLKKAKQLVAASGTAGQSIQVWASNTDPAAEGGAVPGQRPRLARLPRHRQDPRRERLLRHDGDARRATRRSSTTTGRRTTRRRPTSSTGC